MYEHLHQNRPSRRQENSDEDFRLCNKADILFAPSIVSELVKEKILRIPGDVCSAVMTQVQYAEHASQQCEKRPGKA